MGVGAYLMWMALGAVMMATGLLRVDMSQFLWFYVAILGVSLATLLAIRTGFNRRFADPSLTAPQIGAGVCLAGAFLAAVEPGSRGVTLLLFVSVMFFGVFRLRRHEFIPLALLAVAFYSALIAWEAPRLTSGALTRELTHLTIFGATLLWLSVMGSYVARLRSNLRRAVVRIEEMAHTDELTGSENRRSITDELRQAMAGDTDPTAPLAVCLIDLDRFKRVNDTHGHGVGDEVLQEFVRRVARTLRTQDRIGRGDNVRNLGRFGGEEFLVVLRGADLDGARRAAERIRATVAETPFETSAGPVPITASIGVAAWEPPESESDLIRRADDALYKAKEHGRNRVSVSSPSSPGDRAGSTQGGSGTAERRSRYQALPGASRRLLN